MIKNKNSKETIEILAKQILEHSRILPDLPWFNHNEDGGDKNITRDSDGSSMLLAATPYLTSLERVLDIRSSFDGDSAVNNGLSLIKETNRSSDSRQQKKSNSTMCTSSNVQEDQPKLLTCTDFKSNPFHPNSQRKDASSSFAIQDTLNSKPQYWSPPLDDYDNSYTTDQTQPSQQNVISSTNIKDNGNKDISNHTYIIPLDDSDFIIPSLEDYSPFNHNFYTSVGKLISFVYSQTSSNYNQKLILKISDDDYDNASNNASTKRKDNYHPHVDHHDNDDDDIQNISNVIEQYTLGQDVDPVRITRILSALMQIEFELTAHDDDDDNDTNDNNSRFLTSELPRKRKQDKTPSEQFDPSQTQQENDKIPASNFMDFFLYHVEQNNRFDIGNNLEKTKSSSSSTTTTTTTTTTTPFIQSIFKHYSTLPQLESHVNTIIRKHKSLMTPKSGQNMDIRVEHMKKTQILQTRLEKELENHISSLEGIIGTIYLKCDVNLRMKMRLRIGHILHHFIMQSSTGSGRLDGSNSFGIGGSMGIENTNAAGIDSMLKILHRILEGVQMRKKLIQKSSQQQNNIDETHGNEMSKVETSYEHLLIDLLLPLHKPSGMVLWRDQQPILGLYHVSLVQCIGVIASLDKSLIGIVIKYLIHPDVWPLEGGKGKGSAANTPKVILLLHEIDTLIGLLRIPTSSSSEHKLTSSHHPLSEVIIPLVTRLATSIASDNSRTSERALEFFKNEKFKSILKLHLSKVMTILLRALCRIDSGMDVPWNPTVRKMTVLVLRELESFDKNIFHNACASLSKRKNVNKDSANTQSNEPTQRNLIQIQSHDESPSTEDISLAKTMKKWKPPKKGLSMPSTSTRPNQAIMANIRKGTGAPPLTVTGVAPWSVKSFAQKANNAKPPLTVTGVAPWAVRTSTSVTKSKTPVHSYITSDSIGKEVNKPSSISDSDKASQQWIQSYINKLKPPQTDAYENDNSDGYSKWSKVQMAESPLLLPTLKFHDLVFGQDLGSGSFSTVKYARQISKGKTRSHWPEFAVKVISTEKIEELGYEYSVNREIAILQLLSHPGIARLVSSFRFREGAYLVLEYGSGGDLHSLLKQNGSLDEKSTRCVVGELVAALHSIHELGLVYVDLKPENILVTESGHVKITDFGGCRPLTDEAKLLVKSTGRNLLKHLRDGDWRDLETLNVPIETDENTVEIDESNDVEDDIRIEGTTAYLPPEVILGSYPTFATDSWALGCVFYQCLAGKPPLLGTSESRTKQKIVSFDVDLLTNGDTMDLFSVKGNDTSTFSNHSRDLIKKLLSRNPTDRPNMISITEHGFFSGVDVFNLFKRTSSGLVAGGIQPQPNAAWTRRQFSSIWAPQPQAYNISSAQNGPNTTFASRTCLDGPIIEGNESQGLFLSKQANRRPMLVGIAENI